MIEKRFHGDRLRAARERMGMSQEELAARIGAAQTQITRYEKNNSQPSQVVLIRIAEALSVSTDFLLGLVSDPDGHITLGDLSPAEARIISAVRRGDFRDLIQTVARGDEEG